MSGSPEQQGWIERAFGTRRFFALFNVQVISALGDWVGFFAITSLAATISTQPEAAIALVTTARVAPGLFLAPFVGVLVDRVNRRTIMITADVARAGVFLLLPLVRTVPGLIFASLILEVFTLMWSAAKEATVPSVVPPEKLTTANSLSLVAAYATMPIAGPIQFGLKELNDRLAAMSFLGFLGLNRNLGDTQSLAFYFDALSFLASAFILGRFVFRGMPTTAPVEQAAAARADLRTDGAEAMEAERSYLRRTFDEIREGWEFIYVNPIVRGVILGLACGLMGGAMLVPLGPTFARFVIGNTNTFPLFITALGVGVATGVVLLSVLQKRINKEVAFPFLVMAAGVSMFFGVSMSTFWLAALGVFGLGLFAGAVYVLGFTLLQAHTDDELRGRIFATMLTLVRLCVLLALLIGPFLATIFNGFARAATGDPEPEVPTMSLFGFDLAVPGVRITLWLAALILIGAGVLAGRSMRLGLRSGIRQAVETIGPGAAQARARANHPAANGVDGGPPEDGPGGPGPEQPAPADRDEGAHDVGAGGAEGAPPTAGQALRDVAAELAGGLGIEGTRTDAGDPPRRPASEDGTPTSEDEP
ncbi:MAG: MFS transporter [Microthrixaceae bacterium]